MSFRLQRHEHNPILLPDPTSDWACYNVFNPSVIHRLVAPIFWPEEIWELRGDVSNHEAR